jgi:dolichyl-phosphate beta-glucosyltransferase
MSAPRLSVVVPAYNEAAGIADTLRAVVAAIEGAGIVDHEVLVVDNASTDGTPATVEAVGDPRVRLLRNARNLGKGASMRRGMLEARVIVGSRLAPGADVGRRQPLSRRIAGRTFVDLCRLLLREPTRDLFCGFKLWRAEAAEAVYRASRLDGWVFDAETLAIARALGYRIAEVGVPWNDRAGSRLSMPRVIVPVTLELLAARRRVRAIADEAAEAPLVEARVAKAAEPHG